MFKMCCTITVRVLKDVESSGSTGLNMSYVELCYFSYYNHNS